MTLPVTGNLFIHYDANTCSDHKDILTHEERRELIDFLNQLIAFSSSRNDTTPRDDMTKIILNHIGKLHGLSTHIPAYNQLLSKLDNFMFGEPFINGELERCALQILDVLEESVQ